MEKKIHLDFITGVVLVLMSLYILIDSYRMAVEIGGPFYASPGMMPAVLGGLLLLTAVLLLSRSIRDNTLVGNVSSIKEWLCISCKSTTVKEMLLGIVILGVYTFILAPKLPFLISTFLFLVFLLGVLNATSPINIAAVSILTVGGIYVVFQVIFSVPLP